MTIKAMIFMALKWFVGRKIEQLTLNKNEETKPMSKIDELYAAYKDSIDEARILIQMYVDATKRPEPVQEVAKAHLERVREHLVAVCAEILSETGTTAADGLKPTPDTSKPPEVQIEYEAKRLSTLLEYFDRLIVLYSQAVAKGMKDEATTIAQTIAEREYEVEASMYLMGYYNQESLPKPEQGPMMVAGTPAYLADIHAKLDKIIYLLMYPVEQPKEPFVPPVTAPVIRLVEDTRWVDTVLTPSIRTLRLPAPALRPYRWQRLIAYDVLVGDPTNVTISGDYEPKLDRQNGWILLVAQVKPITVAQVVVTGMAGDGKRIVQNLTFEL